MERELLDLVAGARRISRQDYELRILSAWELMQAQREAEDMGGDNETGSLRRNACVLSRAVVQGNTAVFTGGRAVLEAWSAERIGEEMAAYRSLARRVSPKCGQEERVHVLLDQLRQEPMERIRWRVLKSFGVLPSEGRAREMTEGDYLYCALQLMLDREDTMGKLCPACQSRMETERCRGCGGELAREQGVNPQFDAVRFEEMKRGG